LGPAQDFQSKRDNPEQQESAFKFRFQVGGRRIRWTPVAGAGNFPARVPMIGTLRDFYKPNFAYDASNFYISPDLQIITDRSYMLMHMGHRQDSKGWVPRKMQCQQASWIMT